MRVPQAPIMINRVKRSACSSTTRFWKSDHLNSCCGGVKGDGVTSRDGVT
jgi:hypothetical protein